MLRQGSVVQAWVSDPQGQNRKLRPLIIVTPTEEISSGDEFYAVAVTTNFTEPLNSDEILLPFHPTGQAKSGLRKKCVAKCSWLVPLLASDVHDVQGFIATQRMAGILHTIGQLPSK